MKLQDKPFSSIKEKTKIYELRLYDEKRRKINVGDIIKFTNMKTNEEIFVVVEDLILFNNFSELFNVIDKKDLGYNEDEVASSTDMDQYYSKEEQRQYGVVAIKIKLCSKEKKLELYMPGVEDYWYEQKIQADPLSMDYNAGYDVSYYGYHYDTGCIDFPEERWKETYEKRIRENRYFAYIKDND
jgi:ASC-1-like (ASCH) protein